VLVTFTLALMVFERESGLDAMAPEARRTDRPAKVLPAEPQRTDQPGTPSPVVLRPIAPAPPISQALQRDPVEQGRARAPFRGEASARGSPHSCLRFARIGGIAQARGGEACSGRSRARRPERARVSSAGPAGAAPAAAPAAGALSESGATFQRSGVTAAIANPLAVSEAKERTPEKWLEDIRKLRTEGKATEVERELAEFRKRYPDYILPEDLR